MKRILAALLIFTLAWVSTAEAANYAGTSVVWQVMSGATAANVNGAGFNPANANFPTDGVIAGGTGSTATLTPTATYAPSSSDNNAWAFFPVQANVTYPIWCQITTASGGVATLNSAIGACVTIQNGRYVTNTVAGVATTATPTLTYGIDYSQQTTARYTDTTGANTTTAFTDSGVTVGKNWVGNFIHIISGTGSPTVGWYECVSEVTATCTLDRTAGTSGTALTYYVGGAASLASTTTSQTDANFFSQGGATTTSAAYFFIQGGSSVSYSLGQAVTFAAGNANWPVTVEGFASIRGDRPSGATRPTLAATTFTITVSSNDYINSLQFTGTAASILSLGANDVLKTVYVINKSTSGNQSAVIMTASKNLIINSELVSERGYGVNATTNSANGNTYVGNYFHDSNYGLDLYGSNTPDQVVGNIFSGNKSYALFVSQIAFGAILNNTFYGAANNLGTGVYLGTISGSIVSVSNNIFSGLSSGIVTSGANSVSYGDYNDFYNNTTNYTTWNAGANDITTNPTFTNVAQVTGTTATSATTVLTDSGKNFTTAGVVAGRDYVYVSSCSGCTTGIYGITTVGTTTITLDNTIGSGTVLVYGITTGRNWGQSGLAQTTGFPQLYPASNQNNLTNGNFAIGAAQPTASAGTTGYAWSQ